MNKPTRIKITVSAFFIFLSFSSFLLAETFKPLPPEPNKLNFTVLPLPEDRLQSLPGSYRSLLPLAESMKSLKVVRSGGKEVVIFHNIPFLQYSGPKAIVLSGENPEVTIPVSETANVVYFLFALVNPGEKIQSQCRIFREDGMMIDLLWKTGLNIGPSIGRWKSNLNPDNERPGTTEVIWEPTIRNGSPVRLFCTTWVNDNEWYAISRLSWRLINNSAQLLILGVTLGSYK